MTSRRLSFDTQNPQQQAKALSQQQQQLKKKAIQQEAMEMGAQMFEKAQTQAQQASDANKINDILRQIETINKKNVIILPNSNVDKKLTALKKELTELVKKRKTGLQRKIKDLNQELQKQNIQDRQQKVAAIDKLQNEILRLGAQSKVYKPVVISTPEEQKKIASYKDTIKTLQQQLESKKVERNVKQTTKDERKKLDKDIEKLNKDILSKYSEMLNQLKEEEKPEVSGWFKNLYKKKTAEPIKPAPKLSPKGQLQLNLKTVNDELTQALLAKAETESNLSNPNITVQQQQVLKIDLTELTNKINQLKKTKQTLQKGRKFIEQETSVNRWFKNLFKTKPKQVPTEVQFSKLSNIIRNIKNQQIKKIEDELLLNNQKLANPNITVQQQQILKADRTNLTNKLYQLKQIKPVPSGQLFKYINTITQKIKKAEEELAFNSQKLTNPDITVQQQQVLKSDLTNLTNKIKQLKEGKQLLQKQVQATSKNILEPLTKPLQIQKSEFTMRSRPKFTMPSTPKLSPDILKSLSSLVSKFPKMRSEGKPKQYTQNDLIRRIRQQLEMLKDLKKTISNLDPAEQTVILEEQQKYERELNDLINQIGIKKEIIAKSGKNISYLDEIIKNLEKILTSFKEKRRSNKPKQQQQQGYFTAQQQQQQQVKIGS